MAVVLPGGGHTAGLKDDGTLVAVGDNGYGQCNVGGWKDIKQVPAGDYHPTVAASPQYTVGVKSDGTAVVAGLVAELAKWDLR